MSVFVCVCHVRASGMFCRTFIDGIGTCWPHSKAGEMVSRPCPELLYGVRYNTTSKKLFSAFIPRQKVVVSAYESVYLH